MSNHTELVSPAAVRELGALVAESGYFEDAKQAAQAAVKIMAGAELGLGPIASMRDIDIIKGEVTLSAGAVAALVRRSGVYDYRVKQWDDSGCAITFFLGGELLMPVSTFGPEDARKAGLDQGQNYKRYARNMYFARAMTNGARLHCPDLFVGSVYTPDEISGSEPADAVLVPEPQETSSDASEATGDASTGLFPAGGQTPEEQELVAELTGLLSAAKEDGMTRDRLRLILDTLGLGFVKLEPGWLATLKGPELRPLHGYLRTLMADDQAEPDIQL